jgi:hypothetical protein
MITMQKWLIHSLISATLGWVSGCESLDKVKNVFAEPIILACPGTRILADASKIIHYAEGAGRDLTDVVFEGEIQNITLACLTKIDEKNRVGVMEVEVGFNIAASRGPADRTRKAIYPYFVIVTDLNKKIIYREELNVSINFSGNRSKLSFASDLITIELPLRPEVIGKSYLVYGGFVLTREQLEHNRLRRKQRTN